MLRIFLAGASSELTPHMPVDSASVVLIKHVLTKEEKTHGDYVRTILSPAFKVTKSWCDLLASVPGARAMLATQLVGGMERLTGGEVRRALCRGSLRRVLTRRLGVISSAAFELAGGEESGGIFGLGGCKCDVLT